MTIHQGPPIERLVHRLTQTPEEFLRDPVIGKAGEIPVDAVVNDLMIQLGGPLFDKNRRTAFRSNEKRERNRLRVTLVAAWLLYDDWFCSQNRNVADPALEWLQRGLVDLATLVAADLFVTDPDRREELARLALAALDYVPAGESQATAEDRLGALDTIARTKVMGAIREAEKRAAAVRKKMEEQRARESAAKANREW
jgi:hypothetical protein